MKENIKFYESEKVLNATLTSILAIAIAVGSYASLYESSKNRLTKAKNATTPSSSEQCESKPDMDCYEQVIDKLCDGQNTMFEFDDDTCETITYWKYVPRVNIYR